MVLGDEFRVVYRPAANTDSNVTFKVAKGGFQDTIGNVASTDETKTFAVDTKKALLEF